MKKRVITMCLMALMIVTMLAPAVQANYMPEEVIISIADLGNGITVESTITVHESISTFNMMATKRATKKDVYKVGGQEVATISLTASFGYDGSSSWVNSASVTKSIASGWTYSNEDITTSGGTASGGTATVTATLKKTGVTTTNVYTYISCSPDGEIS